MFLVDGRHSIQDGWIEIAELASTSVADKS